MPKIKNLADKKASLSLRSWALAVTNALNAVRNSDHSHLTTDATGYATLTFSEQRGYHEKPIVYLSVEGDGNHVKITSWTTVSGRYTAVTVRVKDEAFAAVQDATVHIKVERA